MKNASTELGKVQAILLDLDATLVDSRGIYTRAFQHVFRDILGVELRPEDRKKYMGLPTREFLSQYSNGKQVDELVKTLNLYLARLMPEIRLFEGFETVLPELHRLGIKLAVVTSQTRVECQTTRQYLHIDPWIDQWVTVEDSAQPKPGPEPVWVALMRLGVAGSQALMVGDSEFDLKSGRAAGVRVGAALWGAADPAGLLALSPDSVFHTPQDLLKLIQAHEITSTEK